MRLLVAGPLALALLVPATADAAKPKICRVASIHQTLANFGYDAPTKYIDKVECSDITDDGKVDALFSVASGGTAGDTHYGVISGSSGSLLQYDEGYKIGIDAVSSTRFDVQQPNYGKHDANCCPTSWSFTSYNWTGSVFIAGKTRTYKKPKKRFYIN
ncbi:MAG: hypothetical protein QOF76_4968 [Solirubrobacteraceae bacterium]|jgi:hypothetical protein|nr:hypothetical protein [Solirubrobacteraceae bacterium]